jgi:hypothetical protein
MPYNSTGCQLVKRFSDRSLSRGSPVGKLLRNGRRDVLVSVSLLDYFNNPSLAANL